MATDDTRRAQAARLKTEREQRGWGMRRMARLLRDAVDDHQKPELPSFVTYVKRWESGTVEITDARYRAAYARVLDIPESDLFAPTLASASTSEPNPTLRFDLDLRESAENKILNPVVNTWAEPIYNTVLNPAEAARRASKGECPDWDRSPGISPAVRRSVRQAVERHLASDYSGLATKLPSLIGQIEFTTVQATAAQEIEARRLSSDIYAVAGWTLIKADSVLAAWVAASRAISAAESAADPLRAAAATRCLAEVYMRAGQLEDASRTAFLAATYLDDAPKTASRGAVFCIRGAAFLSAAAAAARRGDKWEARTAMKAATACASELGRDRSDLGTVFGPTNVAIHKVAISVELGNAREALANTSSVNLDAFPRSLSERHARYLIDVARCHALVRDRSEAINVLLKAEKIAPEELRNHRLTHKVLRSLLAHGRKATELQALADRCTLSY